MMRSQGAGPPNGIENPPVCSADTPNQRVNPQTQCEPAKGLTDVERKVPILY